MTHLTPAERDILLRDYPLPDTTMGVWPDSRKIAMPVPVPTDAQYEAGRHKGRQIIAAMCVCAGGGIGALMVWAGLL